MPNYAPRVSLPYDDLSGVVAMWAETCQRMAVYEHEADEEVNTTHVHIIMLDCKHATAEALKRDFRKLVDISAKGNDLWAWSHKKYPNPDIGFLKYMSKGHLRPKFLKNISPAEVEEHRALWVEQTITPDVTLKTTVVKMTKYEVVKAVEAYFDEKRPKDFFGQPDKSWNPDDESILLCIRRKLIDNQQALGVYKVMDIFDAYVMYTNKLKFVSECLNILEKRKPRI